MKRIMIKIKIQLIVFCANGKFHNGCLAYSNKKYLFETFL